jgi:hypothetical protein
VGRRAGAALQPAVTLAHWQQRLPEPGAVALQAGPISPPAAAPQRRAEARER